MYQKVGSYRGQTPLEQLAGRIRDFEVAYAPSNYGTTVDHLIAVRDAFQKDVDLPGEWVRSMLVVLKPDSFIRLHSDLPNGKVLRHHLVLQTNADCWSLHGREWQQLELGGWYTMDETVAHASVNFGQTDRIHLVVDIWH